MERTVRCAGARCRAGLPGAVFAPASAAAQCYEMAPGVGMLWCGEMGRCGTGGTVVTPPYTPMSFMCWGHQWVTAQSHLCCHHYGVWAAVRYA